MPAPLVIEEMDIIGEEDIDPLPADDPAEDRSRAVTLELIALSPGNDLRAVVPPHLARRYG